MLNHDLYNALPQEIKTALESVLKDDLSRFVNSPEEPAAIRVNSLKLTVNDFLEKMKKWDCGFSPHPYNPTGLILHDDISRLTHTLSYYCGEFHGQGISSQIPVLALDPQPGDSVLDMAASPGSKSTQIAAMMQNKGRLLLCDPSLKRQQPLLTNTSRAGIVNDVFLQMPGQRMGRLFYESFDRVLVDAPCSGLSKLPGQVLRTGSLWSVTGLETLLNTQKHMLVSAIKAAKPGGTIVYSTCTLTAEENEAIVNSVLADYPVELQSMDWLEGESVSNGILEYNDQKYDESIQKTKRVFPHPQPFEAFFVAKLKKTDTIRFKGTPPKIESIYLQNSDDPRLVPVIDYISERWGIEKSFFDDYKFNLTSKRLWLCGKDWESFPAEMFIKSGLPVAVRKGNQWKLTSNGAQFFGNNITQSFIELEEKSLKELFYNSRMDFDGIKNGYYALKHNDEMIGAVSFMLGKLKISLPHQFNLIL